jgi:hypothetical protein
VAADSKSISARSTTPTVNRAHRTVTLVAGLLTLGAFLEIAPAVAAADGDAEQHRVAVLELGATGEREISERSSHLGPAVGIEIEAIEDWLEIELGASRNRSRGATNWELELPFKRPFRLSGTIEVMPGLGPTWTHTTSPGERASTWGTEAVLDFFFWRTPQLGWYLEPGYGITFGYGNNKSVTLTAGFFYAVQ